MTWWPVKILDDAREIHSSCQFGPCLRLSFLRSRSWNTDFNTYCLSVKRSQNTLAVVWRSETGRGKKPNKNFITKQVTAVGIWSLTPPRTLRSSVAWAPPGYPTQKVGGSGRICTLMLIGFCFEGCSQRALILTALWAHSVDSCGRRMIKVEDLHSCQSKARQAWTAMLRWRGYAWAGTASLWYSSSTDQAPWTQPTG